MMGMPNVMPANEPREPERPPSLVTGRSHRWAMAEASASAGPDIAAEHAAEVLRKAPLVEAASVRIDGVPTPNDGRRAILFVWVGQVYDARGKSPKHMLILPADEWSMSAVYAGGMLVNGKPVTNEKRRKVAYDCLHVY